MAGFSIVMMMLLALGTVLIIAVAAAVLLFIAGLVLCIVGQVNKKKLQDTDKKWPVIMRNIGIVIMALDFILCSVFVISIAVQVTTTSRDNSAERVTSSMGNVKCNQEKEEEYLTRLLGYSEALDKEGISSLFVKKISEEDSFDLFLDEYLMNYPSGLSLCDYTSDGSSYTFCCDGEELTVRISCYDNFSPEMSGIVSFSIENRAGSESAAKLGRDMYSVPIRCDIFPGVTERHIMDSWVKYQSFPERVLTEQEMADQLEKSSSVTDFRAVFGEPNAMMKETYRTTRFYYLLGSEDDEKIPEYFCAEYMAGGQIYRCFVCGRDTFNHDVWRVSFNVIEE